MNALIFFMFIGLAHWTAHILQCKSCQKTFVEICLFTIEGLTHVFGWPIQAMSYLVDIIWPSGKRLSKEEIEMEVKASIQRTLAKRSGFLEVTQKADESDDAFHERIKQTIQNHAKTRKADL